MECRIGDIYSERSQRGADDMELLSVTLNDGVMPRSEIEGKDNSSEDKSNYKVVCKGDMVYNSMRMWQGANGVSDYDGIVSPAYTVLMPNKEIDNRYFASLFKTPNLINEFRKYSQGLTSDTWNLKYPQIRSIRLYIPSLQEQHKISVFISTLEERIGIQRQLVDSLKKYKRGVFEAIFSRKLRLVPKEKQKDWKVFKLNEFASRITRKNNGATDIPLTISAQYGLIDQRDFFSKVVASADMSGYYLLRKGEYAYNRSTSNEYPFGSIKRLELYNEGAVSTLYLCFSINEKIIVSDFAKWYFESSQWYSSVNKICSEGARNHGLLNVPTDGFFNTTHILPSDIKEQMVIATFLSFIQGKLERSQENLDQLNQLRSGLMQKLFI
ncbi:restriction endonuclease subunit S [Flavonifractor plautii]|nr:restriction endonuclease subunit S [Flavonifractor plautii]